LDIHVKDLAIYPGIEEAIQNHASFNAAPLIVVSRQDRISGLTLAITIPKNTIQINTWAFWKGRRRNGHTTPDRPDEEVHTVSLITKVRNTRTYTQDKFDPQHAIFTTLFPDMPRSIHAGLHACTDGDQLALRAGFTTRAQALELTQYGTPSLGLSPHSPKASKAHAYNTHTRSGPTDVILMTSRSS
jgi:hypothetical protein